MTIVSFTKIRIRPAGVVGVQGTTEASGVSGTLETQVYLPLFNVMRVDLSPAMGRPSRKFYRIPVPESAQDNGQFVAGWTSGINGNFIPQLLAVNGLCDESGNDIVTIGMSPTVGMRQLRRGSRRRTQPVL
jgi:hypothetical protein